MVTPICTSTKCVGRLPLFCTFLPFEVFPVVKVRAGKLLFWLPFLPVVLTSALNSFVWKTFCLAVCETSLLRKSITVTSHFVSFVVLRQGLMRSSRGSDFLCRYSWFWTPGSFSLSRLEMMGTPCPAWHRSGFAKFQVQLTQVNCN